MARKIIAVVVAYVATLVLISVAFTAEYMLLGARHAFKPGSFEASNEWIGIGLVLNLVISMAGGFICAAIAKSKQAVIALAVVMVALGLVLSIPSLMVPRTGAVRTADDVPMFEAMQKAEEPRWVPLTLPIIGMIGVMIGGKLKLH
jgi:hypothetical protein